MEGSSNCAQRDTTDTHKNKAYLSIDSMCLALLQTVMAKRKRGSRTRHYAPSCILIAQHCRHRYQKYICLSQHNSTAPKLAAPSPGRYRYAPLRLHPSCPFPPVYKSNDPSPPPRPYHYVHGRQELGEQEWTIDNNGELLVVDRQRGDAMSKTVVTALYSVRDAVASRGDPTGGSGEARRKGGVGRGEEAPAWGRGNKTRRQSSSSSSLRRMSTSRRLVIGRWCRQKCLPRVDVHKKGIFLYEYSTVSYSIIVRRPSQEQNQLKPLARVSNYYYSPTTEIAISNNTTALVFRKELQHVKARSVRPVRSILF